MKIRSVLEYAAPVFFSMLTSKNISDIERIQKIVLKIIFAENYLSYKLACQSMSTVSLEERRQQLPLKICTFLSKKQTTHALFQAKNIQILSTKKYQVI